MRLREFRRDDAPSLFSMLTTEFPEEEALLGMRADGFAEVVRRLYRPNLRIALGLLRAFGRSPFHLYVIEEGGAIAATTLLSFAHRTGFLSTVVVAPAFRRRGFARRLIEEARRATARRGRPYVALRVLESNGPARARYGSAGYRTLDHQTFVVHDSPATLAGGAPTPSGIRPFARPDARALADIANRAAPEPVKEVLPMRPRDLFAGSFADRLFSTESAAWVVDRGNGPEAHVAASSSPTTEAAHLSSPIVAESVEPPLAAELVRTATAWLAARSPTRVVASVADTNRRGRLALEQTGFHDAITHLTLYRPSR